jgi:acyl-CoA synthetase (AMP-forming)/AMP-acid ligase II
VSLTTPAFTRSLATASFARELHRHGPRTALLTDAGELSYRELAERVAAVAAELGTQRRLVLLLGSNTVDAIVTYLAALSAAHPVLLAPGGHGHSVRSLADAYDPDVVAGTSDGAWRLEHRRVGSAHDLHPDLALLLSTSGSTGSTKLVRLSHANLQANAEAIAEYLGLGPDERAATTLPMSYCYGLSVINSHLLRGAGLILTDRSVTDPEFWRVFADRRGTSFAGVPYTFELLDRIDFASMSLPHLRYLTQAGGRLAPARVRRFAALGRRDGWRLFVMYGQTEATARMAYLPPDLADTCPEAIGVPVPGGSLRVDPLPGAGDADTGELVYSGPNVMLGYAKGPADLALGRTVEELRTGDLARRRPDGLFEVVGRRGDFAKIAGLRIDPRRVEAVLAEHAVTACCLARGDELLVAVVGAAVDDADRVRRLVARGCGLPPRAVDVRPLAELPRLANGKPDYEALRALPARRPAAPGDPPVGPGAAAAGTADLCRVYAEVLDRTDVTEESTFVGLRGDSLSYVELSVRLEQALGDLPADWHRTPIRELRPSSAGRSTLRSWVETSVALRALAIVFVVGTHAKLFAIAGGAHLLLGVAGFNLARFHLTAAPRPTRVRGILRGLRRVVLASVVWIGLTYLVTDDYDLHHILLLHYLVGPPEHNPYWFIEALTYVTLPIAALLALPQVDRAERRHPFALPMVIMLFGLITRYQLVPGVQWRTPAVIIWLVALGWAIAKSTATWHRVVVSVALVATVPGYFHNPAREAVLLAGMLLLTWIPRLPSLRPLNVALGLLAGASLYIYLTHWQVYPKLDHHSSLLATVASLAFGLAVAAMVRLLRHARTRRIQKSGST